MSQGEDWELVSLAHFCYDTAELRAEKYFSTLISHADISGGLPERPMGTDCKSVGSAFDGSNPSSTTSTETPPSAAFLLFS